LFREDMAWDPVIYGASARQLGPTVFTNPSLLLIFELWSQEEVRAK
jgi:hypothetical protein